jgi:nucleotide-binding universal stress UspA family protein
MAPYTKVLVSTDFSEHAGEALDTAIDLALRYRASLAVVHVFDRYTLIEAGALAMSLKIEQAEDDSRKALDKLCQLAAERVSSA